MHAVGIDGCERGWVAADLADDGRVRVVHLPSVDTLTSTLPDPDVVGIDIPLVFPPPGMFREAEIEARALLGPRRNSVFLTPPRDVLEAPTYEAANALAREEHGSGISRQAYGLRAKVFEVERWRPDAPCPVREVHPELSFTVMLDAPAGAAKRTWAGQHERRDALAAEGIEIEDVSEEAGERAGTDDVLDAIVAAWTARRIVRGEARSLPATGSEPPEARIWA